MIDPRIVFLVAKAIRREWDLDRLKSLVSHFTRDEGLFDGNWYDVVVEARDMVNETIS